MGGLKLNDPKRRLYGLGLIDLEGGVPYKPLTDATGRTSDEISQVLNGLRCTPAVQEAIAGLAGMSVGELFGEWAWFRQAGRYLRRRLDQQREGA